MRLNCPPIFPESSASGGFTLVELSVGLTIWVVVTMSLTRVFQSGLASWKHTKEAAPLEQEARVILDQMAREFRNSIDVPGLSSSGASDGIAFATVEDGAIEKVNYKITGPSLHRFKQVLSPAGAQPVLETVMTSRQAAMIWEYAYASTEGNVRWLKEWNASSGQPQPCGIRVKLILYDASGRPEEFTRAIWSPVSRTLPWATS